ncbi:MAG: hypothetical protein B5766_02485 [Candidatus Lumbricidophila eiseniae]|uniref:HTH cro/C1-type domain-containing protein n=1 Tax=Candidatus Lumbricidiphila eiseniae TaxID=1969409 RepID=A0A2A6FTP9_9MICO|nr:MAG: hypothetical protein B5766_02485 [Candidatus Lumbricidophila eiseniae]
MDTQMRARAFANFIGLELKGRITTRGYTALAVAIRLGHSPAAFNRWLNGKTEIPLSVYYSVCEVIGVDTIDVADKAARRVIEEHGKAEIGSSLPAPLLRAARRDVRRSEDAPSAE